DDARPSWSGDGGWIYFRSDREGKRQIWKIPYTGWAEPAERAERVTGGTAHEAFESPDAKWVYFVRQANSAPWAEFWWGSEPELWRVPDRGGREEKVLAGVHPGGWGLAESSIFFLAPGAKAESRPSILFRVPLSNPEAKAIIRNIDRQMETESSAFAVSRDGRSFLLAFRIRDESDLFLVTDFR